MTSEHQLPEEPTPESAPVSDSAEPKQESTPANEIEELKKSSPSEAFARLESALWQVHDSVGEIGDFVRRAKDVLFHEAETYRLEGRLPVLESLFQLHDLIFKRVVAMEAGESGPDAFVIDILRHVEQELERHQVRVLRPDPGTPVDLETMHTLKDVPAGRFFWRKPDTVARVHRCGFAMGAGEEAKVLRPVEVDVYRKRK